MTTTRAITTLSIAATTSSSNSSTSNALRAACTQQQAILQAAADGDLDYLQSIVHSPSDTCDGGGADAIRMARCVSGCSALHWAAGSNRVDVIEFLVLSTSTLSSSKQNDDEKAGPGKYLIGMNVDETIARNKKAAGRTPMHYAARNGSLEAAKCLQQLGANVNARAKHGVTPFQLALFQNQRCMASWLVECCNVDIFQTNDFGCNAAHWLAICPRGPRSGMDGVDLIPTAEWLHTLQQEKLQEQLLQSSNSETVHYGDSALSAPPPSIPLQSFNLFTAAQKQGHGAMHKAAWMGHTALVRHLHERFDIWDDTPDFAGNHMAVLAEMGRHLETAEYIRRHCSRSARDSCAVLGISIADQDNVNVIRRAYLQQARRFHPDHQYKRNGSSSSSSDCTSSSSNNNDNAANSKAFDAVCRAYHHLTVQQGRGQQHNPSHSIKLLLLPSLSLTSPLSELSTRDSGAAATKEASGPRSTDPSNGNSGGTSLTVSPVHDTDCFEARLLVVLQEYGTAGLDISNLQKKWRQVWPHIDFPKMATSTKSLSLLSWIRTHASNVVDVRRDEKGCYRLHAKNGQLN